MDNDPKPGDDTDKKMEELMSSPNINSENEAKGEDVKDDGFGSIENELEVDKDAIAQAEAEKKAEEEKVEVVDGPVIATDEKAEKKAKSKKRSAVLAVILILLLAGCGVAAYFVFGSKPEEKKSDNVAQEQQEEESSLKLKGNELSDFDLNFLKYENKKENLVYSPLSIKYALAMLKDGANGETKKQIEDIIGDYKAKKYINSRNTSLANGLFIRDTYKDNILDSYITGLKDNYDAEVVFDSFSSPSTINKWVSNKTLGLVKDILSEGDLDGIEYALVNALAIDQKWVYLLQCQLSNTRVPCKNGDSKPAYSVHYDHEKFDQFIRNISGSSDMDTMTFGDYKDRVSATIGASFNRYDIVKELGEDKIKAKVTEEYKKWLETDDVKDSLSDPDWTNYENIKPTDVEANVAQYMKELKANYGKEDSSTDFYFNDTEDVKVFAKDLQEYDGNTLQYVGIMPKNEDLDKYVTDLKASEATELINGLKELKKESFKDGVITRIDASIPMFKYNYTMDGLIGNLGKMGITDVFDKNEADLSGISKEGSYIARAKHAATIEFSNEGIKAGAATIMGGAGGGGLHFDYQWDVPVEKIDLSFNKPFLYLIRDKNSGEIWFVGTVYEPSKK